MPLQSIFDQDASVVLDVLTNDPVQARTEKTCGPMDLEPDPTTKQFDWNEEVGYRDHHYGNVLDIPFSGTLNGYPNVRVQGLIFQGCTWEILFIPYLCPTKYPFTAI
uniref:Uncharacterized protein n=1 Tax=Schizaphis graminum TaxID=13262 RepID=A0A2S2PGR0_SCHGA